MYNNFTCPFSNLFLNSPDLNRIVICYLYLSPFHSLSDGIQSVFNPQDSTELALVSVTSNIYVTESKLIVNLAFLIYQ